MVGWAKRAMAVSVFGACAVLLGLFSLWRAAVHVRVVGWPGE